VAKAIRLTGTNKDSANQGKRDRAETEPNCSEVCDKTNTRLAAEALPMYVDGHKSTEEEQNTEQYVEEESILAAGALPIYNL
jgi:hypothetical protein